MSGEHWNFEEWENATVDRIVGMVLEAPEEHRADYLRVQIRLAIRHALRHGRSGRADHDLVVN
jgi:hypothetical protein